MAGKRILLIRTGGLGDTVLMWPALFAMRRRFPDARIDLMGHRSRCEVLAVPAGADLALDVEGSGLHHLFEISMIPPPEVRARFASYQTVVVFAAPGDYALPENLSACGVEEVHAFLPTPSSGDSVHAGEHLKRSLLGVDLAVDVQPEVLPVTDQEREDGAERINSLVSGGGHRAIVAPGSGSAAKNWDPDRFAGLIGKLRAIGLQPILLQGPADKDAVERVAGKLGSAAPPVWRDDPPRILKGGFAHATLFVGNDSGPAHLAAAIGTPTVAIFGPSDPVRWAPWGPKVSVVHRAVSCSPCSADDMHACEARVCLDDVRISDVLEACRDVIQK